MSYEPRKIEIKALITITPGQVPGTIQQINISEAAVTGEKIKDYTIESRDIAAQAIETFNIKDRAVNEYKISLQAVKNEHLGPDSVTTLKIAAGAIGARELADGAITTAKVLNGQITQAKLGPDVGISALGTNSVDSIHVKSGAITESKLATDSVTSGKIKASAVGQSEIATGAVTASKIADGAYEKNHYRYPAQSDFTYGDFTSDDTVRSLDLAGIIPVGTKAIILDLLITCGLVAGNLELFPNYALSTVPVVRLFFADLVNEQISSLQVIMPVKADRTIDYKSSGTWTHYLTVRGYIK